MTVYPGEACAKYEKDESLPAEFQVSGKDTCLNCKHAIKAAHDGEVDIVPCGKFERKSQMVRGMVHIQ